MAQQDFICTQCPLDSCDEESLFCCLRWATNPNKAQLEVATFRLIPQRLTDAERSRKWRLQNPERYNELQRERRARKRAEQPKVHAEELKVNRKALALTTHAKFWRANRFIFIICLTR